MTDPSKRVLLSVADGPESIEICESEEKAIVDWAGTIPAIYIEACVMGAYVRLGPFNLKAIREGVIAALVKEKK